MGVPDLVEAGAPIPAEFWIKAAQASVRSECGWHVAPSYRETLRLDGSGGRQLLLPSKHVTEVHSVVCAGVDVTDEVYWSRSGTMEFESRVWPSMPGVIEVELTHGFDAGEVPEVAALMVTLARRARAMTSVAKQGVNGASVEYFAAGGAPLSVPLLGIEKDLLAAYRLNWSVA